MIADEAERAAYLRAICEVPDDDNPRYAYADWLAKHDKERHARFIRAQLKNPDAAPVELGLPEVMYEDIYDWLGTWSSDEPRTDAAILRPFCFPRNYGWMLQRSDQRLDRRSDLRRGWRITAEFRRGFVSHITLLSEKPYLDAVPLLFVRHPISAVTLVRPRPLCSRPLGPAGTLPPDYQWRRDYGPDNDLAYERIHPKIFAQLDLGDLESRTSVGNKLNKYVRTYSRCKLAKQALSNACVRYGRKAVGLPYIPRKPVHEVPQRRA